MQVFSSKYGYIGLLTNLTGGKGVPNVLQGVLGEGGGPKDGRGCILVVGYPEILSYGQMLGQSMNDVNIKKEERPGFETFNYF